MNAERGQQPQTPELDYRTAAGTVVRRLRGDAGQSLREFAELAGVAHTSLHAIERGETTPTMDTLARVAAVRKLTFPAILALVLDELVSTAPDGAALSKVVESASALNAEQLSELLGFVDYLKYRDRPAGTPEG